MTDDAYQLHQRGLLDEAAVRYREILAAHPGDTETLHMLGVLLHQQGRSQEGLELVARAAAISYPSAGHLSNLAAIQLALNQLDDARISCERAIAREPNLPAPWANLGVALRRLGQNAAAVDVLERALTLEPGQVVPLFNLAVALQNSHRLPEAISCYERLLTVEPDYVDGLYNLGLARENLGDLQAAAELYRRTITLRPDHASAHMNLGNILLSEGLRKDAHDHHNRAVELEPHNALTHYNLALTLKEIGHFTEMEARARRALELDPKLAEAWLSLGNAHDGQARPNEALACYREALAARPNFRDAHNNILSILRRDSTMTGQRLRGEFENWARQQAGNIIPRSNHRNTPDPQKRLRIGYVSPDFREHSVAFFMEPLIAAHDRSKVEVFCYYTQKESDGTTQKIKSSADHWRDVHHIDEDALAAVIEDDGIDILIDCAGHSIGHRLYTFARKPAPVQVTTLVGHESTTGLSAIDWIIGDPQLTPPGTEAHFTERLFRLPRVIAPFRVPFDVPAPSPRPPAGDPVIACFAQPNRIGPESLGMWSEILDALPRARLLLKHPLYGNPFMTERWKEVFAPLGGRVEIEGVPQGWRAPGAMDVYERVSLMLDTTPQSGATTTLLALWMGVPVVSMAGSHSAQRFGASILSNAGVPDLVAADRKDYIVKTIGLATDRGRLKHYRETLRPRLKASPWCDTAGVTREIEDAYRSMWRTWCAQPIHVGLHGGR